MAGDRNKPSIQKRPKYESCWHMRVFWCAIGSDAFLDVLFIALAVIFLVVCIGMSHLKTTEHKFNFVGRQPVR
jgi:preprotein translocase subunit SecG